MMMLLTTSITISVLTLLASVSAGPLLFHPHDQLSASTQTCKNGLVCRDDDTCCEMKKGAWSCCPFKKATCCKDKLHCCPGGMLCNLTSGYCEKKKVDPMPLMPLAVNTEVLSVVCPDQSECPDGNTCCQVTGGEYGCCPLPDATCCSDKIHCCPEGYTCDVETASCNNGAIAVPWLRKAFTKILSTAYDDDTSTEKRVASKDAKAKKYCCSCGGTYCPIADKCCHVSDKDAISKYNKYNDNKLAEMYMASKCEGHNPCVVCCDGKTYCPENYTCCRKKVGSGYTCCPPDDPMHEASKAEEDKSCFLCRDGKTCCPFGQKCCDTGGGYKCCDKDVSCYSCVYQEIPNEKMSRLRATALKVTVRSVKCPDGKMSCPDQTTCCQMSTGDYGCCPQLNANCCPDHIHCCAHDQICDLSTGACRHVASGQIFPLLKKFEAKFADVVCPDGSYCPSGNTCCELASGKYGCCPMPSAVCCSDHIHCCPNGYTCDTSQGTCNKGTLTIPLAKKTTAKSIASKKLQSATTICPDMATTCNDNNTCCLLESGGYGCCPFLNAVCCTDKLHCCPPGYRCDVAEKACLKPGVSLPVLKHISRVVCPDQRSFCHDGNTCCRLAAGDYGCCPLPNAVCCSDHAHCCPVGYTCDNARGMCVKGLLSLPWLEKTAAVVGTVICRDGSTCPSKYTCCKLPNGQFGCCPHPRATCCSDHIHCCPEGFSCHGSLCTKGAITLPWLEKIPATRNGGRVRCPDGRSSCPSKNTCCKLPTGQYGCCPLPHATCCSDYLHCCPEGYTCHILQEMCTRGEDRVPWREISTAVGGMAPVKAQGGYIICPGEVYQCPDLTTCCKTATGAYSCCPLPHAVCCKDYIHCCPSGYTCAEKAQCRRKDGEQIIAAMKKWPALSRMQDALTENSPETMPRIPLKMQVNSVICPDRTSQCPDHYTCCKLTTGQYGCCPLTQAVCCTDHIHCCPHGFYCHRSTAQCTKGLEPWGKIPLTGSASALESSSQSKAKGWILCPDKKGSCPGPNATCCLLASGKYGCCPFKNASCCRDQAHCCPHGMTCDPVAGTCYKETLSLPWLPKLPATPVDSVKCPDGVSVCPSGDTCCKLPMGQYGCCPMANAVCCSDHLHCCPHGYSCDTASGMCTKGSLSVPWVKKISLNTRASNKAVGTPCPDPQYNCNEGQTCCRAVGGKYACCPCTGGVCCPDMKHCCPDGYFCDLDGGTCKPRRFIHKECGLVNLVSPIVLLTKTQNNPVNGVICPDGTSECPDGNTCCKLISGQYGCCPLPNAVCCSDLIHCCPHGTTCDVAAGTCIQGTQSFPWFPKTPPSKQCDCNSRVGLPMPRTPTTPTKSVICPDRASECPSGNTCCKLSNGEYGCCPLPEAVCCSDHTHCCPHDYTCDISTGRCNKSYHSIPWQKKVSSEKTALMP